MHFSHYALVKSTRKTQSKVLSTLSQKSETVAQKWDCRWKRRDNGDSLTFLRQCMWTGFKGVL